jgi:hypothetical protein
VWPRRRLSITLPADGYRELKAAAVHIVRAYRGVILSALVAFVAAVAWVLLVVPPFVGFGLSVASAMGWCFWLDRHPEVNAHDDRPSAAAGPTVSMSLGNSSGELPLLGSAPGDDGALGADVGRRLRAR